LSWLLHRGRACLCPSAIAFISLHPLSESFNAELAQYSGEPQLSECHKSVPMYKKGPPLVLVFSKLLSAKSMITPYHFFWHCEDCAFPCPGSIGGKIQDNCQLCSSNFPPPDLFITLSCLCDLCDLLALNTGLTSALLNSWSDLQGQNDFQISRKFAVARI